MNDNVDYSKLPEHMQYSFQAYVEQGAPPGSFMYAVLCDKLSDSFANADSINRHRMLDIVSWLYNEAPALCHGSPERVKAWVEKHEAARQMAYKASLQVS